MLLSHRHRFIFLKTKKTGGTSVERALQGLLLPRSDPRSDKMYSAREGIVGARGHDARDSIYFNHMTARDVREHVGADIFDSYLKAAIVRNPYDKAVSWFFYHVHKKSEFGRDRAAFNRWLRNEPRLAKDARIFAVDGEPVGRILRYENLQAEVDSLVSDVTRGKVTQLSLGNDRSGFRDTSRHWSEYYNGAGRKAVELEYALEFKLFGYTFEEPDKAAVTSPETPLPA